MPTYKVTYFNVKALGEPIRMLLSYLGEDFEDIRINGEDWPKLKDQTPFGKLPLLEEDGKVLHQSAAVSRYLGKKAGLAGKNDWEAYLIDMTVDTFNDFRYEIAKYYKEEDQVLKEKKKEMLLKETIPYYMKKFDEGVVKNGGYIATNSLSWGDIYIVCYFDAMEFIMKTQIIDKYPNLKALREKVSSVPKIKAWIDKRPKTEL